MTLVGHSLGGGVAMQFAFLRALRTFLTDTAPAHWSAAEWRDLLRRGRR
ncbi:MAG: hypothetical protein AVDCRST_MAG54-1272 [uncultured Actinomycetospora sp.]|uniref:Uncharacterized protein n=1 Tax=uncultured Actinomycetospora sp. TaxID=1135996 RepID=A0A6J4HXA1_9PSEU|nr:MAG: hypothetical protein AVDCRST_MAG54-1272 [uncultured Actinomycetospora sp.]